MNWTEGKLARHSRRKGWNFKAAKEKQHFATSARQKALRTRNATSVSSFVPSYISSPSLQSQGQVLPEIVERGRNPGALGLSSGYTSLPSIDEGQDRQADSRDHVRSPQINNLSSNSTAEDTSRSSNMANKRRALLAKSDWMGIKLQKNLSLGEPPALRSPEQPTMSYRRRVRDLRLGKLGAPRHRVDTSSRGRDLGNRDPAIRLRIGSQIGAWSINGNTVRSCSESQKTISRSRTRKATRRPDQPAYSSPCSGPDSSLNASASIYDDLETASLAANPATPPGLVPRSESKNTAIGSPAQTWHMEASTVSLQHPRPRRRVDLSSVLNLASSNHALRTSWPTATESSEDDNLDRAVNTIEENRATPNTGDDDRSLDATKFGLFKYRPPTPTTTVSLSDSLQVCASLVSTHTSETHDDAIRVATLLSPQVLGRPCRIDTPSASASASIPDSVRVHVSPEQDCPLDNKFRQPQPFVGSRTGDKSKLPAPLTGPPWQHKGRSNKTRGPDRPDIRALPSFDEDPIEE